MTTTDASVTLSTPAIFRAKCSRARRVSSGATTDVNWRPRASPKRRFAAPFIQRMTPVGSMTYAGTPTSSIAPRMSPGIAWSPPRSENRSVTAPPDAVRSAVSERGLLRFEHVRASVDLEANRMKTCFVEPALDVPKQLGEIRRVRREHGADDHRLVVVLKPGEPPRRQVQEKVIGGTIAGELEEHDLLQALLEVHRRSIPLERPATCDAIASISAYASLAPGCVVGMR